MQERVNQTTDFRLSKLKEIADDNYRYDKHGGKSFETIILWEREKMLVTNILSLSHILISFVGLI